MRTLKRLFPAIVIMVIIFVISSIPGKVVESVGLGKESVHVNGHFLMFFLLGLSYYRATHKVGVSIFLTLIYGVLDEFHQYFVPLRSVSSFDVLTDFMGGMLAGGVIWSIVPLLPTKLNKLLFY